MFLVSSANPLGGQERAPFTKGGGPRGQRRKYQNENITNSVVCALQCPRNRFFFSDTDMMSTASTRHELCFVCISLFVDLESPSSTSCID